MYSLLEWMLKYPVIMLKPGFDAYVNACEGFIGDTRACTWFVVTTIPAAILCVYAIIARALLKLFYRAVLLKRIERWKRCQERIVLGRRKRMVLRAIRGAGLTPVSEEGQRILSFYFGKEAWNA